ncbi:ferritin-like domain-containing protein [Rheinheimera baltica]|uniref:ferritin-like domain-containing protein n=1 Tax=Rheinheimera baltica TaxID=67576 RepID=UPI00041E6C1D|nr:DUF455 family protein [Rheinheimera baltica]
MDKFQSLLKQSELCLESMIALVRVFASFIPVTSSYRNKCQIAKSLSLLSYAIRPLHDLKISGDKLNEIENEFSPPGLDVQSAENTCREYVESRNLLFSPVLEFKYCLEKISKECNDLVYERIKWSVDSSLLKLNELMDYATSEQITPEFGVNTADVLFLKQTSPETPSREFPSNQNKLNLPAQTITLGSNFINLEIPTIECCASILNEFIFDVKNTTLLLEICIQIDEERRHAEILRAEFETRGGKIEELSFHLRFWMMSRDEDLATRLYIHQKLGEWIGIDAAMFTVKDKSNEAVIREIYSSILLDEIDHVSLGNKWIRRLTPDLNLVKEKALSKRKRFNETDEGPLKFKLNEMMCRFSGFSIEEINAFRKRQEEYGVIVR